MGDLDYNQFQPNDGTNNTSRAFQTIKVAKQCQADSNEEAHKRHHSSTYTDDEKKWLVKAEEEERKRGRGFMERLKKRWDEQYPEKHKVSKQNLRDNAVRFKREMNINMQGRQNNTNNSDDTSAGHAEWTNEMKINLLTIEERERSRGRGFMKRMKEAWDSIYGDKPMSAQCLRDNAARFRKDKAVANLIEVRDRRDLEPDQAEQTGRYSENSQNEDCDAKSMEGQENFEVFVHDGQGDHENKQEDVETGEVEEESEDVKEMRIRFIENLNKLNPTTNQNIEERDRLTKLKVNIRETELANANKVLKKHLSNTDDVCKIVDAVYAMGRTIEERMGIKRCQKKTKKKGGRDKNRRIRKLEKQIKESRRMVAWLSNEIHRRETRRKLTEKEKRILERLRSKVQNKLIKNEELLKAKEIWLEELQYRKTKLRKVRTRDEKIRNNRMFREDTGMFYRKINNTKERRGTVPDIDKFVQFWAGIWEDETSTPHRRWMRMVAEKIRAKIINVEELRITEEKVYKIIKKRKNWSAPGIDGIQNFWWKKFQGTWKALVRSFNVWIEQPQRIPDWVTHGRTVLLPKLEDLSDVKEYRPITCLNTCYKIFAGNVGKYMKDHAERNNIWDRSQLGTCSGVLGTVDQLIVDNTIMDEVRGKKRNLAVAFYDYRKAYDMVRHDWMLRVYRWMGVPEKVLNVLSQLMEGWKTRLEVTCKGKVKTSRWIRIRRGFLQGDSYSPVGFCLTEVPIALMLDETDGYKMGQPGERKLTRTHSFFIDDLKVYQENHQKLEIVNEMIVKASMDTGACYGVKKCAEVIFKNGKMVKGEGLAVLEERMKALDPEQNEVYKFLGCEQGNNIDVKRVMQRVKKEISKRLEQLIGISLNDENLVKAINSRVVPVAGYVMNICNLGKGDIEELDKIVKTTLRKQGFHGKQASDERLYGRREEGGRGLKSFTEVYDETKVRVACYMVTSNNDWIKVSWRNEYMKEQTSLKRVAEEVMRSVKAQVEFNAGEIKIGNENYMDWKVAWKKLKNMIREGQIRNKSESLAEKRMQSEKQHRYLHFRNK